MKKDNRWIKLKPFVTLCLKKASPPNENIEEDTSMSFDEVCMISII